MNRSPLSIVSFGFVVLLWLSVGTVCFAQDTAAEVTTLAQPLIDSKKAIGLSIGTIAEGKTSTFHFGKTDLNAQTPDDATVYEIGSITKVFTGVLLADAVCHSAVTLEQPAGELLPDGVKMPVFDKQPIRLLDLATHRSGLPRLPDNLTGLFSPNPYAKYTSANAYEFLNSHQLRRDRDAAYEYSNFGTSLLGHLLCLKADLDYDELLGQTITGPLEMGHTAVELSETMKSALATPHSMLKLPTNTWEFADMPGAGGIRSTTPDMLRFAAANLDPPESDIGRALELAWKQHRAGDADTLAMGLGWHIARDGHTRWHNGATGGYRSMLMVDREHQVAVIVLCNTACPEIDNLAEQIMQSLAAVTQ